MGANNEKRYAHGEVECIDAIRAALTDEGDGLSVIRGVLDTASRVLIPGGRLLMEFGAAQGECVTRMAQEYSFSDIHILKDAGGHDRVLAARRPAKSDGL